MFNRIKLLLAFNFIFLLVSVDDCFPLVPLESLLLGDFTKIAIETQDSLSILDKLVKNKEYHENESVNKYIDLGGATVIPGFVDAHFHLLNLGKQLDTLQLKSCKSPTEIAKMVLKKSRQIKHSDWIFGFGWDQTLWQKNQFPLANILNDLHLILIKLEISTK